MSTKHDIAILNSVLNPLLPIGECPIEDTVDENLQDVEELTDVVMEAKRLEVEAVKLAESGNVDESIEVLSKSIQLAPLRSSGYNNRGQAYRLKGDVNAALQDLNKAIELSQGKGRSACLALCQRALVNRLMNKEKEAVKDFQKAAQMGSGFARAQLVTMNPYAALCNQMLRKVLAQYN